MANSSKGGAPDLDRAVEALRRGALDDALIRCEPRSRLERFGLLFQRMTAPLDPGAPPASSADPPRVLRNDVPRARATRTLAYRHVLAFHLTKADDFYLDDLLPALWNLYVRALYAGRECLVGARRFVVLPALELAAYILDLVEVLGGDAEVGLLTLISGREADDAGEFGRALSFLHAAALWALVLLEDDFLKTSRDGAKRASRSLAAFSPLLVLARFVLRLRSKWTDAIDEDDASRRIGAWPLVGLDRFRAARARVALAADCMAQFENSPAETAAGWFPGALVVVPRSGLSVVLDTAGQHPLVAGFGRPLEPTRRFPRSTLTRVRLPTELAPVLLHPPDLAALEAERELLVRIDHSMFLPRGPR